jgi:hypothetical protein
MNTSSSIAHDHDILKFGDILTAFNWNPIDPDQPVSESNPSWTYQSEWTKRTKQMKVAEGQFHRNGVMRIPGGQSFTLLHNPIAAAADNGDTGYRVVWTEQGTERMFIANDKGLVVIVQDGEDGRQHTTLTPAPEGYTGRLATGKWPLSFCDDLGRDAVAAGAAAWRSQNPQSGGVRYQPQVGSAASQAPSDGGFFDRVPLYWTVMEPAEWTPFCRDLSAWADLWKESVEAGFGDGGAEDAESIDGF